MCTARTPFYKPRILNNDLSMEIMDIEKDF